MKAYIITTIVLFSLNVVVGIFKVLDLKKQRDIGKYVKREEIPTAITGALLALGLIIWAIILVIK